MIKGKDRLLAIIYSLLTLFLILVPTGFQRQIYHNAENAKAEVLSVNNSPVVQIGLMRTGEQTVEVRILSGSHKGQVVNATNFLTGSLETDVFYAPGDRIFVLIENKDDGLISFVNTVDHYRLDKIAIIFAIFAILMITFSGATGMKTLMGFAFTILMLIKALVPLTLKGYPPLWVGLGVGVVISIVVILLVSGINRRSASAIVASTLSSLAILIFGSLTAGWMELDGTQLPWVESLLYAGFTNLNLSQIFLATIYLSCSGAMLDLAIDVSSGLEEIVSNKPEVTNEALIRSGYEIGKTVIGTQTTTLLLAYIGSYLTIMMVFMAQGTPIMNIMTTKAMSAEILLIFVGCIGLIFVPPITTLSMVMLRKRSK